MAKPSKRARHDAHRAAGCPRETHQQPAPDEESDDAHDVDPQSELQEIWEPLELDEEEDTEPEYGDFWHEPPEDEE